MGENMKEFIGSGDSGVGRVECDVLVDIKMRWWLSKKFDKNSIHVRSYII